MIKQVTAREFRKFIKQLRVEDHSNAVSPVNDWYYNKKNELVAKHRVHISGKEYYQIED